MLRARTISVRGPIRGRVPGVERIGGWARKRAAHLGRHGLAEDYRSRITQWRVAMEIARRAGGDPGQPGLFGAPELYPALQPVRLIAMETAGWAGLDAKTSLEMNRQRAHSRPPR